MKSEPQDLKSSLQKPVNLVSSLYLWCDGQYSVWHRLFSTRVSYCSCHDELFSRCWVKMEQRDYVKANWFHSVPSVSFILDSLFSVFHCLIYQQCIRRYRGWIHYYEWLWSSLQTFRLRDFCQSLWPQEAIIAQCLHFPWFLCFKNIIMFTPEMLKCSITGAQAHKVSKLSWTAAS